MEITRHIVRELRDLRHHFHHRLYVSKENEKAIVDNFHRLYYESSNFGGTWANTRWMGIPIQKCPLDLWVYQEIIHDIKPDLIIETGTAKGASALFLAQICDIVGRGEIVTIDITHPKSLPKHKRIRYLLGSSTSPEIIKKIEKIAKGKKTILVILDSDHSGRHVLNELNTYKKIVTKGSYIIVEDTNTNNNPARNIVEQGGAIAGVRRFMSGNRDFITDKSKEKFYMTFNPEGYLKRIR
jgi:cephalosporin hydroxylase